MIKSVKRKYNRQNLILVCRTLESIAPFPFFGTLLGITREEDIIKGDDDIDLYVDSRYRDRAIELLRSAGFKVEEGEFPNNTKCFVQATRNIQGIETFVDIYLYENIQDFPWIIDKWNFGGNPDTISSHLHIRKDFIFPLKTRVIFGEKVFVPRHPKRCVQYLYGNDWEKKISKSDGQYGIVILKNSPFLVKKNDITFELLHQFNLKNEQVKALDQVIDKISKERDEYLAVIREANVEKELFSKTISELRLERDHLDVQISQLLAKQSKDIERFDLAVSDRDRLEYELNLATRERDEVFILSESLKQEKNRIIGELSDVTNERNRFAHNCQILMSECDQCTSRIKQLTTEQDQLIENYSLAMHHIEMQKMKINSLINDKEISSAGYELLSSVNLLPQTEQVSDFVPEIPRTQSEILVEEQKITTAREENMSLEDLTSKLEQTKSTIKDNSTSLHEEGPSETTIGRSLFKLATKREFSQAQQRKMLIQLGFDYEFYLRNNSDVAKAGVDALDHFIRCGRLEGRNIRFVPLRC